MGFVSIRVCIDFVVIDWGSNMVDWGSNRVDWRSADLGFVPSEDAPPLSPLNWFDPTELVSDVDHDDDMTLNDRPNIDHGDDTEASETSPFNDILSLSPLFRRESTIPTSSVGSNQFSGESRARSEGTSPAQLWRDRNHHPDFPEHELRRAFNMREEKIINPELWQACSGPLVNLPAGTHVVYFPQGHCEQVAASMRTYFIVNAQIPNYPGLPSKLLCLLHNVTLLARADPETDELYAQMTLQPVPSFDNDALLRSDLSMKINKPQTEAAVGEESKLSTKKSKPYVDILYRQKQPATSESALQV
ncbi:hypothetical protein Vadar_003312 [Vaccinium darrowii]|uniref:Uncharacterized protein n=1 Tax=Vaccinium darrowii TaxID=229202 RepID=A0ACB7Y5D9_9ERIC|nr:hypothetical protein Vadar_003312 [Vaccinium darrowii]